jgi:hypothetical protein
VTEGDKLARKVPDVDTLPAAVRLAAVAGQGDAQRAGRGEGTHKLTPVFDWNRRWFALILTGLHHMQIRQSAGG